MLSFFLLFQMENCFTSKRYTDSCAPVNVLLHFFSSACIFFCMISRSVKGKFDFDISVEQLNSNSDKESIWHKILLFLKK